MRVDVRGKRWVISYVTRLGTKKKPKLGDCDPPSAKAKRIRILKGLEPFQELVVLVHELIHAGCWDLDESVVEELAEAIATVLWNLGWRKAP